MAEESCVDSFNGITDDVWFRICCSKLWCCNCGIPDWIFSSKWLIVSGIHDVILILQVSWIVEWCYVHILLGLYWCPKVSVWRGVDGAWWIQTIVQKEVMCILWLVGVCLLCMLLQSQKVLLICNWSSRCTHVVGVLYEVAIVLWSKSINLYRDAATGQTLSLTTNHTCFITFPGLWNLCPMIWIQELL